MAKESISLSSAKSCPGWAAALALTFAFPTVPAVAAVSPLLTAKVPASAPARPVPPGYFDLKDGIVGYIPPTIPPGIRPPLLVLLHGAGGDGVDMIERFKAEADRRGIVLLAPRAGGRTWDTVVLFNPDAGSFAPLAKLPPTNPPMPFGPDVGRVDRALSALFEHVAVDPERIALAGFSDGATYALALGLRNPRLFGTVIALSPGFAYPTMRKGPQRVFLAHGTRDPILPFIGSKRDIVPNLERHGYDVTFVRFEGGHEMPDEVVAQSLDLFLETKKR